MQLVVSIENGGGTVATVAETTEVANSRAMFGFIELAVSPLSRYQRDTSPLNRSASKGPLIVAQSPQFGEIALQTMKAGHPQPAA